MGSSLQYIDSFAAYDGVQKKITPIKGLKPRREIRGLVIECVADVRDSAVGGFNLVNQPNADTPQTDIKTIAKAFFDRFFLTYNNHSKAIDVSVDECEYVYGNVLLEAMFLEEVRDGYALNGSAGAVKEIRFSIIIPFVVKAFETRNMFCLGSEQLAIPNTEVGYTTPGAGAATKNVAGLGAALAKTAAVTMKDVRLHVDQGLIAFPIFGATHYMKADNWTTRKDVQSGGALELLVADESGVAALHTKVQELNIFADDFQFHEQVSPKSLANLYVRTRGELDVARPYELQKSVAPILWQPGRLVASEREYFAWLRERTIGFTLNSGQAAGGVLLRHYVAPIEQDEAAYEQVRALYPGAPKLMKAPVRGFGGRDNDLLWQFKARELR